MSLLGLVRHMAEVERAWFRRRFGGSDVPKRYQTEADPDGDFYGAVADPAVVDEAWAAWRDEIAFADQFTGDHDLDFLGSDSEGEPVSLRELLVHMIEEYARHNGHADLLRERIDGRVLGPPAQPAQGATGSATSGRDLCLSVTRTNSVPANPYR
jgi:uncharacterized damage-inducible protein DinB